MTYLITPDELLHHLESYHIVDLRPFHEYAAGHVAGAVPSPINIHLSDSNHNLIDSHMFTSLMAKLGIDNYTNVVVYDSNNSKTSAIFWYTLMHYGHVGQVLILDGGWPAVEASELPVNQDFVPAPFTYYVCKPQTEHPYVYWLPDLIAHYTQVKLLDTRSHAEWNCFTDYGNPRSGRMPGAVHIPFSDFTPPAGELGSLGDLSAIEAQALALGLEKDDPIVIYCQHGARASLAGIALRSVGYTNVIVYEGSMYEWTRHPALALEMPKLTETADPVDPADLPKDVTN